MDSELPSFSLSVLMAGKIDGMEIGESGFVPFLIKLKLPDSELADGKTEYSTSDSLLLPSLYYHGASCWQQILQPKITKYRNV